MQIHSLWTVVGRRSGPRWTRVDAANVADGHTRLLRVWQGTCDHSRIRPPRQGVTTPGLEIHIDPERLMIGADGVGVDATGSDPVGKRGRDEAEIDPPDRKSVV